MGLVFLKGGVDTPVHSMYFNFANGDGMKHLKWLKKTELGTVLYFTQFFLHYILYYKNFNVKVEKMVAFVKTFDHYHRKFNYGNLFCCPVKLEKNLKLKFRSKFFIIALLIKTIHTVLFKKLYTILR